MSNKIVRAIKRRNSWKEKIKNLGKDFIDSCEDIQNDLNNEIFNEGIDALMDHLRVCQYIPEEYERDSFEEKLYAKYTDHIVSLAFQKLGIDSIVLGDRSNSPDILSTTKDYKFITDVKSMRLSRTAKNQKDFKIVSLSGWGSVDGYSLLISPLSQYPSRSSEIYQQAVKYSVCLLSYSHICLLLNYKKQFSEYDDTYKVLGFLFSSVSGMVLDRSASNYWSSLHNILFKQNTFQDVSLLERLWTSEMDITDSIIDTIKRESIDIIENEMKRLDGLSLQEAIAELKSVLNLDSRRKTVESHINKLSI